MSQYEVNTEGLYTLAQALNTGADRIDARIGDSARRALNRLQYQRGGEIIPTKQRLGRTIRSMEELRDDLRSLAGALQMVIDRACNTDNGVYALLQGLPACAVRGEKIIETDYTGIFIKSGNKRQREFAIGWTSPHIKNIYGLFDTIIGGDGMFGDTIDEAMIKESLEDLLTELDESKAKKHADLVHEVEDTVFDDRYNFIMKAIANEVAVGKEITQDAIDKLLKSINGDDASDEQVWEFLMNKVNMNWLNKISKGLSKIEKVEKYEKQIVEAIEMLLTDYTERVKALEAIREAMRAKGYENEIVERCIKEMIEDYQSGAMRAIKKMSVEIMNEGVDGVLKDVGLPVKSFLEAQKDINKLTGAQSVGDALRKIYGSANYSYALAAKYDEYAKRIQSGNYTPEDAEKCKLYFELARQARIQECKAIKDYQNTLLNVPKNKRDAETVDSAREIIAQMDAEIDRLRYMDQP